MDTVYFYCATIGGGILVLQTLLMVFAGADADFDTDLTPEMDAGDAAGATSILFQLSLKTIVAFVTFFGLTGITCQQAGIAPQASMLFALGAGAAAFVLVGYLMHLMTKLQVDGNLRLQDARGATGQVYLRVPGSKAGIGKVTVTFGGRTVTQKAATLGPELPTGSPVVIDGMATPDTFLVSAAHAQQ